MSNLSALMRWLIIGLLVLSAGVWGIRYVRDLSPQVSLRVAEPIKVGVLHSLTGTMADSERRVAEATLFAIEEINANGGLLGRPVIPIVRDGNSDASIFAFEAEELIKSEGVVAVFGCWTSVSRKTVRPIFEKYNNLLFYPLQYEGMEMSPNIVYMGAAPNQQIIPAVKWAMDMLGDRFFIVGSDYVFPRAAAEVMKDQIRNLNGRLVGEFYVPLGSTVVGPTIRAIQQERPDVILNLLNGDSNFSFFEELRAAGITSDEIPTISFSVAEPEVPVFGADRLTGDYAAWNYFQNLPGPDNEVFVNRFKARFGEQVVVSDPMVSAYLGVKFWAEAVAKANSTNPQTVRQVLDGLSVGGPQGPVSIDGRTMHTWKPVFIGKIKPDGQFEIVWRSHRPVRPIPYPHSRTPLEWERFLKGLFTTWGNNWENPGRAMPSRIPMGQSSELNAGVSQ
jgi:urea transport system substrate-binding protein